MSSSTSIIVVFEDDLSGAVLRKILPDKYTYIWIRGRGSGYIKKNISEYNRTAKTVPVLVLTDLDRKECAPTLIEDWLPFHRHNPELLFRVAVREVESWVLADRGSFAKFLGIERTSIQVKVDEIDDPKEYLINLVRRSNKRELREAIVPGKGSEADHGPDYNGSLTQFIREYWDIQEAMCNSPSLKRAIKAVENFHPEW